MKVYSFLVLHIVLSKCYDSTCEEGDLNDNNFLDKIKASDVQLVMFYSPVCTPCKNLKPIFKQAQTFLLNTSPQIPLYKLNCIDPGSQKTCIRYKIRRLPTLLVFKHGNHMKYNGLKTPNGIIKYMKLVAGPTYVILKNTKEFQAFIQSPDITIVGFFNPLDYYYKNFILVAEDEYINYRFGVIKDIQVIKENNIKKNTVILHRPNYLHNKYESDFGICTAESVDGIRNWINENKYSIVDQRTLYNIGDFKFPLIVIYYNIDWKNQMKDTKYWRNIILDVAHNYIDTYNFAISDKIEFKRELNYFGYWNQLNKEPVIFTIINNTLYGYTDKFTSRTFMVFVSKLSNGELKPYKGEKNPANKGCIVYPMPTNSILIAIFYFFFIVFLTSIRK